MAGVVVDEEAMEWEEWKPEGGSFVAHMVSGSLAGIMEHTVMYPVDTLKTHVQCDRCGKLAKPGVSFGTEGCIHALKSLVRQAGVNRLWRGVTTMFVGCVPAHAAYFSIFEEVKRRGNGHSLAAPAAGMLATLAHDVVMNPLDTAKQRLQLGHYDGLAHCVRTMVRTEGVRGLFVSLPTSLAMNLPFGAVMVSANEAFKPLIAERLSAWGGGGGERRTQSGSSYTVGTYLLAGSGAGAIAACATTPLDMVKTRLQTQNLAAATTSAEATAGSVSPTRHHRGGGGGGGGGGNSVGAAQTPTFASSRGGGPTRQVMTGAALPLSSSSSSSSSSSAAPVARRLGSAWDAARCIYTEAGAFGFLRGLVPRVLVSAPSVAVSWTAYETAKSFLKDVL